MEKEGKAKDMLNRIQDYCVLDMEMTGLSPKTERVTEIGAVRVRKGEECARFSCLVNPGKEIPEHITALTGITNEMVLESGEDMDIAMGSLLDFLGEDLLVGQNIRFDYSFLAQWCINKRRSISVRACDTLKLARHLLPAEESKKLENLCVWYQIPRENAHRALDDALETGRIFEKMQDEIAEKVSTGTMSEESARQLLAPIPLFYKAKRQTPATGHQIKQIREYQKIHHLEEVIDWENLTRNEASRIMDRYYTTYGR